MNVMHQNGDVDVRRLELHSGSWADYVEFQKKAEYVWAYPHEGCLENCRCDHFTDWGCDGELPFSETPQADDNPWTKLRCYQAQRPGYGIVLAQIRAVSIVLSPDCCGPDALEAFRSLVARYGLDVVDCLPENLKSIRVKARNGQPFISMG